MDVAGDVGINVSAGNLFQNLGFFFNSRFQKGIKPSLSQKDGTSESVKVHSRFCFDDTTHKTFFGFNGFVGFGI
ncbi:hypothetical protein CI610_03150 [invertebrate metagenome]|uniref:Uncharacterized protein n=1 Tax=invertebrate metagenome TaxID=1711999 RepID=A0A2H9T3W0_9ZZZZ